MEWHSGAPIPALAPCLAPAGPVPARMRRRTRPAPFDVRHALGSRTVPTLIISGEYDLICSNRWARMLHQPMPTSQLLVSDCGHMAHLERPEAFTRSVINLVHA